MEIWLIFICTLVIGLYLGIGFATAIVAVDLRFITIRTLFTFVLVMLFWPVVIILSVIVYTLFRQ